MGNSINYENLSKAMNDRFETKTVTLTPVSPIHISNGAFKFSPTDIFLRQASEKWLFVIDESKLASFLGNEYLQDYLQFFQDWSGKLSDDDIEEKKHYWDIRKDHNYIQGNILKVFLENRCNINVTQDWLETNQLVVAKYQMWDDKHFIRNGNGSAYVPGSSIKGAIRTALVWKMLEGRPKFVTDYLDRTLIEFFEKKITHNKFQQLLRKISDRHDRKYVEDSFRQKRGYELNPDLNHKAKLRLLQKIKKHRVLPLVFNKKKLAQLFDELNQLIFEDYQLDDHGILSESEKKYNKGAMTDFMKSIQVTDTATVATSEDFEEIKILKLDSGLLVPKCKRNGREIIISKEIYLKGAPTTFQITIDKKLLNDFIDKSLTEGFEIPFKSIDDILETVSQFYSEVWNEEQIFFCGEPSPPRDEFLDAKFAETKDQIMTFVRGKNKTDLTASLLSILEMECSATNKQRLDNFADELFQDDLNIESKLKQFFHDNLDYDRVVKKLNLKGPVAQTYAPEVAGIQDFYNKPPQANFRLGYGCGLLGVTIFTLLDDSYRKDIRNLITNKGNAPAPKSRRIAFLQNGDVLPLGWAQLNWH